VRVFKNKWFTRFSGKEGIDDQKLCEVLQAAEQGLIDADLGGGVIKQRVARPGGGKSGGYRTIILYRKADLAFFVFGFPKSERDNITRDELRGFKDLAKTMLGMTQAQIDKLIKAGHLEEVTCDEQK